MFITKQQPQQIAYYEKMLKVAGSLSNLFAERPEPYLGYRLVENLFCKTFLADNLSRSDTSIDALKDNTGIGVKTFIYRNGKSFEKIAEFNKEMATFRNLSHEQQILKIAELRNSRINFAKRTYNLSSMLYHCVTRDTGKIIVYETPMNIINIDKIQGINTNKNSIRFSDGGNNYIFNLSKSTLFKQFKAENPILDFKVKIIADPFEILEDLFNETTDLSFTPIEQQPHIFLPLYSINTQSGDKYVPEKSGLNQWNAAGRTRNKDEIYIRIPSWIHQNVPGFFPARDVKFSLHLPNKDTLSAKVCQDRDKALMSDPNAELGRWLLRDVLNLKEGELLTYERLEDLGIDSVVIYKLDDGNYKIDFAKIGSYDFFTNSTNNLVEEDYTT